MISRAFAENDRAARNGADGGSVMLKAISLVGTKDEKQALMELGKRSSAGGGGEDAEYGWLFGGRSGGEPNLEPDEEKSKKARESEKKLFEHEPSLTEAGWAAMEAYLVGKIGREGEKPLIHRVEDSALDMFSAAMRSVQHKTGFDLSVDDFDIATPDNIAKQVERAIEAQHRVIPAGVGSVSMTEVENYVHTHSAQMLAAAFGRNWKEKNLTPEEEAMAYNLILMNRRKWMDALKDHTFALATDTAAESILGGRLAMYRPRIVENQKKLRKSSKFPRQWFVQDPYGLRPLSPEERKLISWTLWGLTDSNMTLLPISTNQYVPDIKGFGYSLMYPDDAHPTNPDAVIIRPGTSGFIDVLRKKMPFLSPALSNRSPGLVSGTIIVESAATGDIKGIFATLEPSKVIDLIADAGDAARGVDELIRMSKDATLAPNSHPWTKRVPRAQLVLEKALELSQKGEREKAHIRADFTNEGRFLQGDSHAYDWDVNPSQAATDRENERLGQLESRREALRNRMRELQAEAEEKGYIARTPTGYRKTFLGRAEEKFFAEAEKTAEITNRTTTEIDLIQTVQQGRQKNILTGMGTRIINVLQPTNDLAKRAMRLHQQHESQFTLGAGDRPTRKNGRPKSTLEV